MMTRPIAGALATAIDKKLANAVRANRGDSHLPSHRDTCGFAGDLLIDVAFGQPFERNKMSTATFVFMIATYWVGGSGPMEGGNI